MRVISRKAFIEFTDRYPVYISVLNAWWKKTEAADWNNFAEMKGTFNSVDVVGNSRYVFNIGGNKIRLVAMIFFDKRKIYVRGILTHAEYDVLNASGIIKTL